MALICYTASSKIHKALGVFVEFKPTLLSKTTTLQGICGVLSILIVWQGVIGIRSFSSLEQRTHVQMKPTMKQKQAVTHASLNTALFGEYVPQQLNDAGVKASLLNLTVVGVMFVEGKGASHVIIRTAGGHEQTFREGDTLPGGAVIKRITQDGVLILRQGVLEGLSLPKSNLIFEGPVKALDMRSMNEE